MKNPIFVSLNFLILVAATSILFSCSDSKEIEKFGFLQKDTFTGEDSIVDVYPRTKGSDAHSGSYFSRTDSAHQYGVGSYILVNDTNLNKDLRVNVNLWARTNKIEPGFVFAVALHEGDKIVSWNEMDVKKQISGLNTWTNIKDSVTISGAIINKPGLIVKTYAYNVNNPAKSIIFDVDDLEVIFKTVQVVLEE